MRRRAAGTVLLKIARLLSVVHGPADGRGRGVAGGPRAADGGLSAVGAVVVKGRASVGEETIEARPGTDPAIVPLLDLPVAATATGYLERRRHVDDHCPGASVAAAK